MKKIIMITDFIEGLPVVASVRYEDLITHINKHFETIVINNEVYGSYKSVYVQKNYKFKTAKSKFTQTLNDEKVSGPSSKFEGILRNKLILAIWRNYSNCKIKFKYMNLNLLNEIKKILQDTDIYAVFLTVPDVHGLYIADYIKKNYRDIPVVVEVRDILNNSIGKGNPRLIMRKAEKLLINRADGIISLSKGIEDYYRKMDKHKKMSIIRNGYNEEEFNECKYESIRSKDEIIFAHIGSIYKGRNLKDFIKALIRLNKKKKIKIRFDIVGYLDSEALKDMNEISSELQGTDVAINIVGTLAHKDAVKYLKRCDISVILTHKIGSEYAIPGKTFEYIGACKPIIAVTKDRGLIEMVEGKYGECAGHNVEEIDIKLQELMGREYDFEDRMKFSRKSQAEDIINFIEEVVLEKYI